MGRERCDPVDIGSHGPAGYSELLHVGQALRATQQMKPPGSMCVGLRGGAQGLAAQTAKVGHAHAAGGDGVLLPERLW